MRLFILLFVSFCTYAQESDPQKLQKVIEQITDLTSELSLDHNQQEKLQQILKALDLDIAKATSTLKKTKTQLDKTQTQVEKLNKQYEEELKKFSRQQEELREQMRSAFLIGQFDTLKLLLNQTDPQVVGRLLVYFDYFNVARSQMMHQVQANMDALNKIQVKQQRSQEKLQVLLEEQTVVSAKLMEQKQAQTLLVEKLLAEMAEKNLMLETLQADKQALESVIVDLKYQPASSFTGNTDKPLLDHKGKLPWPLQGQVVYQFGDTVVADNKWQGLLIAAPEGEDIKAIYKGRVVYADWLRGFGLIIIVDHGQDYMSLYAHNQSLYKNVGDWVEVNEPIAQVGKSGPIANTGLYFEIRSKGEVQNPMSWLLPKASSF